MMPIRHPEKTDRIPKPKGGRNCQLAMQRPRSGRPLDPREEGAIVRFYGGIIGAVTGLHALSVFALAQDARLPAAAPLPSPPPMHRLSLEDAQRPALANNTNLTLGRLGVQEKAIAVDAASRDYLPKLLGSFQYFHFNDKLGKVLTFRTGQSGLLPPGSVPIATTAVNQESTFTTVTLVQPITKLIAVNAAVQLARADTLIAQAQLDKGTRDLLSGVAQAYHGLYGVQRIEAALGLQVQLAERLGRINPDPEIRVAMIEAQQALVQMRSKPTELTEQLSNLLGLPSCTPYELVEPLPPAAGQQCGGGRPARAEGQSPGARGDGDRRQSSGGRPGRQDGLHTRREHLRGLLQSDGGPYHPAELRGLRGLGHLYVRRLGQAAAREESARDADRPGLA
jgi:hypothetical protein